jgi:integrase
MTYVACFASSIWGDDTRYDTRNAQNTHFVANTDLSLKVSIMASIVIKPEKPYKDYPLFAHANGQWAKKVRGEPRYFGPWADPKAALDKWLRERDYLLAGRKPPQENDGLTVRDLVNLFLGAKEEQIAVGELTQRTWDDYNTVCGRIIKVFGKSRLVSDLRPDDFAQLRKEFTRTHGPVALLGDIGRARAVFNWGFKQSLLDRPLTYGDGFKKPSPLILRRERNKKGPKLLKAKQIRHLLDKASPQLKAMILLGINCGLGNNDCALLPIAALDLEKGWIDYPRPKTEVPRKAKLWPQTVQALQTVLKNRKPPKDKEHNDKVFITKYGFPWLSKGNTQRDNPISKEFAKLLKDLGYHRPGLGFYALRHTFQTVAEECKDGPCVDHIMGHVPLAKDMASTYRERMSRKRLFAVAKHVRSWLFNKKPSKASRKTAAKEPSLAASPS